MQAVCSVFDFKRGAKFDCPRCGSTHNRVHDILNEDRMWRHKDFWQYQTYWHARMPRIKCETCDKVVTIEISWSRTRRWLYLAIRSRSDATYERNAWSQR
ncbi:transposase family protein [Anaerobacillus sp. HL2]|nr:transposase family protein [Anaerobacillus sp. HL2]